MYQICQLRQEKFNMVGKLLTCGSSWEICFCALILKMFLFPFKPVSGKFFVFTKITKFPARVQYPVHKKKTTTAIVARNKKMVSCDVITLTECSVVRRSQGQVMNAFPV